MKETPSREANSSHPETWFDEHGDYLFRYAMLRLRDSCAAEDAVQETLLAALNGYEKFQHRGSDRTWLIGILKHKIVDHFRRARHEISIERFGEWLEPGEFFDQSTGDWKADRAPTDWRATPAQLAELDS